MISLAATSPAPLYRKHLALLSPLLFSGLLMCGSASASTCALKWSGDDLYEQARLSGANPASYAIPLYNQGKIVHELRLSQIQAFFEAKQMIAQQLGRNPKLIICGENDANALATNTEQGEIIGVTIGMLKLADGDRDLAAIVIGHEYAHHIKNHMAESKKRNAVIGLLGIIAGAAMEYKIQKKTGVQGVGMDTGNIGALLVSRKFSRDQEREADEIGFNLVVQGGYHPYGAIRLSEKMKAYSKGGAGLFFDSHPGWDERTERFHTLIAGNPTAQEIIARSTQSSKPAVGNNAETAPPLIARNNEKNPGQQLYNDAQIALKNNKVQEGVSALKGSANNGYALAQLQLGLMYFNGSSSLSKNDAEAFKLFQAAAEQNNTNAINNLGAMYMKGAGVTKNETEAMRLYTRAADMGNTQAMINMGEIYEIGRNGLAVDLPQALNYYQRAAALGSDTGLLYVGLFHARGLGGLEKDDVAAVRFLSEAAEKGNPRAQYSLALFHSSGKGGLQKNDVEAVRLLQLSARQAFAPAQNNLGLMFASGRGGLNKDMGNAIRLYKLAADQGNVEAINNLGYHYLLGTEELKKNEAEGLRLIRIAADKGQAHAQTTMGDLYLGALAGLKADRELALSWYQKAAKQGFELAQQKINKLNQ